MFGPLSKSLESQWVSGAEALYNILKGFFFGWIQFVLLIDSKSRDGFDKADNSHCLIDEDVDDHCWASNGALEVTSLEDTSAAPV